MSYFPDDIQTETASRYTKLQKGTTTLRILGKPTFFYETWVEDDGGNRSPKRFALDEEIPVGEVGPDGIKQTMATKVYNYNAKAIQVWTFSQKTLLKALKGYVDNKKYGDPTGYDINITREGEGKQTRYTLIADPKEPLSKEVASADEATQVDLELLLINADPFIKQPKNDTVDKGSLSDEDLPF